MNVSLQDYFEKLLEIPKNITSHQKKDENREINNSIPFKKDQIVKKTVESTFIDHFKLKKEKMQLCAKEMTRFKKRRKKSVFSFRSIRNYRH